MRMVQIVYLAVKVVMGVSTEMSQGHAWKAVFGVGKTSTVQVLAHH